MRLLITFAVLLALAFPAYAVPLAEWEADEAKLLGEEPVTRADLPDEWQGLTNEDLQKLMDEVIAEAEEHYFANEYVQALFGSKQYVYLSRVLGNLKQAGLALNDIGTVYIDLGQYELVSQLVKKHSETGTLRSFRSAFTVSDSESEPCPGSQLAQ